MSLVDKIIRSTYVVTGVDIAIAILTILKIIIERLGLPSIPLVVCTDLYSLYECLVKLGTTNKKRLIIDIMALRQSNMLLIRVEGSVQRPTE
ncbi:hypothetical protein BU23DRAFT_585838 [Bimuria novae-zelandiae CBS 107.79]|uniref:Uncharacterized protein n=1 Tax=Bimuria novae-zelandiae CBS 107.79 TaxID=1447943 RepID=A0A6A5UFC9_9PLEO|nr:hypothetical protein BU23DRAFT_585838 [Bimuria novae-zelandiae CBS 107.79]